jgi:imidazolonepropionase-like amidohydrolase
MARVLYTNANLLDGERAAQANATVVVEGDRITEVGTADSVVSRPRDEIIDLQGRTLMPGLVMGHFHAMYRNYGAIEGGSHDASGVEQAFIALGNIQIALNCGYTSCISAGTHYNIDVELAEAIDSGDVVGPRLVPCSRNYFPVQEESDARLSNEDMCMAWGPDEFRKGTLYDLERGVKIIKIFASGGHGAGQSRGMAPEEIRAVVETAKEFGARVRAHVAEKDKLLACIQAGVEIVDHADEADAEVIEAFVEHGIFVLPSVYALLRVAELGGNSFGYATDLKDFKRMCKLLPDMVAAGVKLVPGDDFGVWQLPHGDYAKELVCYAEHANIPPLELIKWSTLYGGEMTGTPDLGTIAPGKLADLLIVNKDPSTDISVLTEAENLQAVIKGGIVVSGALTESRAAA